MPAVKGEFLYPRVAPCTMHTAERSERVVPQWPESLSPKMPQSRPRALDEVPSPRRPLSDRVPKEPCNGVRVLYVGGGPRTTTQVSAEIDFLFEHKEDFDLVRQAGGRYDMQSVIAERKGEEFLGGGNAWGPDQGFGTANSGVEKAGIDYSRRVGDYMQCHRDALASHYQTNPVAAALFSGLFDGNISPGATAPALDFGRLTRAELGREEHEHFLRQCDRARQVPDYHLTILTHCSTGDIDLKQPDKPVATLVDTATKNCTTLEVDAVRMNTGTTLVNPITDPMVRQHSFVQPMDPERLHEFLHHRALIGSDGKLVDNARLALGGTGLSVYEALIALHGSMGLFELDDNSDMGYRVTEEAKLRYQGAITFISRTEGTWIAPRHVGKDLNWTQVTDGLAGSGELHSAFLNENAEKVFTDWNDLLRASVAISLGLTPQQVDEAGLTTFELLAAQHERNVVHARALNEAKSLTGDARKRKREESTRTLEGAVRQAAFQTINGLGMERDVKAGMDHMAKRARFTHAGRAGYPMHRAQIAAISALKDGVVPDNRKHMRVFDGWMSHVTSSPVKVQDMAFMLHEAGIASHMQGDYASLSANTLGGKALRFEGTKSTAEFDAFIVSKVFRRSAEPLIASMSADIEPVHPQLPDLPRVTTNRRIVAKEGGIASHVEDYGLNGKGAVVPGTQSLVGAFATDVNNRESATDVAPGLTYRSFAARHLAAVGVPDAMEVVEALYKKHLPPVDEFDAEVKSFAPDFDALTFKAAMVRAAESAAGKDAAEFKALADTVRSGSRVKAQGALLEPVLQPVFSRKSAHPPDDGEIARAERFKQPSRDFGDDMAQRQPFKPVSRDSFMERFVDYPLDVHRAVYEEALALALQTARSARERP